MQVRNLSLLVVCQLISTSGSTVMVTLGGIIGSDLSGNPAFATLPLSMMVVAVAMTTIPATALMKKIGRRKGFSLASVSAAVALLLAIAALERRSFAMFIVAVMLFGINMAFTQQYRYFAAESVATRFVPRAISLVLVGSIGAAFAGREIVIRGQYLMPGSEHAGSLAILVALFVLQALLFFAMSRVEYVAEGGQRQSDRALVALVTQPVFAVAVLGAAAGYGLMTLIMTATPLSMHIKDGLSLTQTASVIQAHVLGMYVPSLVSGFLIERIGVVRLMFVGICGLLATTVIGLKRTHRIALLVGIDASRRRLELLVRRRDDDADVHLQPSRAVPGAGRQRFPDFRLVGNRVTACRFGAARLRVERIDVDPDPNTDHHRDTLARR